MAYDSLLRTEGRSKLSTDLLQVDCQNLLSTGLLQVVSTSCNQSTNDNLAGASLILPDKLQLVEIDKLFATCWQVDSKIGSKMDEFQLRLVQ